MASIPKTILTAPPCFSVSFMRAGHGRRKSVRQHWNTFIGLDTKLNPEGFRFRFGRLTWNTILSTYLVSIGSRKFRFDGVEIFWSGRVGRGSIFGIRFGTFRFLSKN